MPRKPTLSEQADPAHRLGLLLRDALIAAWVRHNPRHDDPDFTAVRHLGQAGYRHVAGELLARGVRLPPETPDA